MDTPKPEEPNKPSKKCTHALMINREDDMVVPYWDCIYCGAVAFFNPGKPGMFIPRES